MKSDLCGGMQTEAPESMIKLEKNSEGLQILKLVLDVGVVQ